MISINLQRFALIFLLILLSACGGTAKKDSSAQEIAVVEGQGEGGDTSFVLIPNPNDGAEQPSVPATARAEFAKALALMEAHKWQDAEGVLTLLTETYPTLAGPFVNLGLTQAALAKPEAAEASWLKAVEINPKNFDAYTSLGVFYREQGRFEDAEATYLKALAVWPHHPATIKNLGVLYDLYMGRLEAALAQYELYQKVIGEEDRQVKGWILDLNRRITASNRE